MLPSPFGISLSDLYSRATRLWDAFPREVPSEVRAWSLEPDPESREVVVSLFR